MIPKNKTGGVVTSTVMGVGALVIAVVVILVVIQTLNNANIIKNDKVLTITVTNESFAIDGTGTATASVVSETYFTSWNITLAINQTRGPGTLTNETLVEGVDYQVFSANGSVGNITAWNSSLVTYDWVETTTTTSDSVNNLTTNFTQGIDNISLRIPTILLIVAVVFLFGALALLIRNAKAMGIDSGGESGSL